MTNQVNHKSTAESSQESIDLKPFINFLVVLIPVLMLSAEFSKTAIQKLNLNKGGSNTDSVSMVKENDRLQLALLITDSSFTIGTNYGFLPTWNYKEYAKYTQKDNRNNVLVVQKGSIEDKSINQSRFEKSDQLLLSMANVNKFDSALYYKEKLIIDKNFNPVKTLQNNSVITLIDDPKSYVNRFDKNDIQNKPLSIYDKLQCTLLQLHGRYSSNASDGNSIIIASESKVVYDKIVQLIDVAKASGFTDVSISKIRT